MLFAAHPGHYPYLRAIAAELRGANLVDDLASAIWLPGITLNARGTASLPIPIPATPAVSGLQLFYQSLTTIPTGAALSENSVQIDIR